MIKNKKGWVARDWVIGIIIFSAIIGLGYLMVGSLAVDYNNPNIIDENFKNNYDKLNDVSGDVSEMYGEMNSTSGFIETLEIFGRTTWNIGKILLNGISIMGSQIVSFGNDFGIPSAVWIIISTAIIAIIVVSIIFIILNALNKTDKL